MLCSIHLSKGSVPRIIRLFCSKIFQRRNRRRTSAAICSSSKELRRATCSSSAGSSARVAVGLNREGAPRKYEPVVFHLRCIVHICALLRNGNFVFGFSGSTLTLLAQAAQRQIYFPRRSSLSRDPRNRSLAGCIELASLQPSKIRGIRAVCEVLRLLLRRLTRLKNMNRGATLEFVLQFA